MCHGGVSFEVDVNKSGTCSNLRIGSQIGGLKILQFQVLIYSQSFLSFFFFAVCRTRQVASVRLEVGIQGQHVRACFISFRYSYLYHDSPSYIALI